MSEMACGGECGDVGGTPIGFWLGFASPYGYLMSEGIDALASRHGRRPS